jgi:integrase
MLASFGLRVGELTHLLVEVVDFVAGAIEIRSKPELFWAVKTGRRRQLPMTPRIRQLLEALIAGRKAGFVFLNRDHAESRAALTPSFASPAAFRAHLTRVAEGVRAEHPGATERELRRAVTACCRGIGQLPEKRVRDEFMRLTRAIGCPQFTRVHDLRHLFSSRAQEAGVNPLLVQEVLGHASLEMTRQYTHLGLDAKREAIRRLEE